MVILRLSCSILRASGSFEVHLGIGFKEAAKAAGKHDIIIAIDVLRCSSSIVTALAKGAKAVLPAASLSETRFLSKRYGAILAGERKGMRPRGFELGNSPLEFTREKVKGRTIVLTTTSGTRAIVLGKGAPSLLVGSLLNLNATAKLAGKLAKSSKSGISLITAGTSGRFSLEDFLCAGALSHLFVREGGMLDDGCIAAAHAYRRVQSDLCSAVREGFHARYLKSIGLADDVAYSTQVNLFDIAALLKADNIVAVKP